MIFSLKSVLKGECSDMVGCHWKRLTFEFPAHILASFSATVENLTLTWKVVCHSRLFACFFTEQQEWTSHDCCKNIQKGERKATS